MNRTVFSTMTERASHHLSLARTMLGAGSEAAEPASRREDILARAQEHLDLTDALAHLGRTVRGPGEARHDSSIDQLLQSLERRARARPWADEEPPRDPVVCAVREAARSTRAAADLWATHRTQDGRARSPEGSRLRHPSMKGAAVRHWQALVHESAGLAADIARTAGTMQLDCLADLLSFPRPAARPHSLRPLPLPLARPRAAAPTDVLDAIDDRVDRIHRHVWELADQGQMSSTVLINVAAIGMLLARSALPTEQVSRRLGAPGVGRASGGRDGGAAPRHLTQGDLERWTGVAAALTPVRTPDMPTTVLQIERLDLARLLERARVPTSSHPEAASHQAAVTDRLMGASVDYRLVAAPCAAAVRALQSQGLLYLAGRHLPHVLARNPDYLAARLGDHLVPAPTGLARGIEARLHAIGAAPPSTGSVA